MPMANGCLSADDLVVRFAKGLGARPEKDAFRLTLLSTHGVGAVHADGKVLDMTKPDPIRLNTNLTTNVDVLRNWSTFQYSSTVLNIPDSSTIEVQTDCGTSTFVLRNPDRHGHVSAVFGDPYYGHVQLPAYANITRQLPGMINNLAEFKSFHSLGVLGDFWYEFSPMDSMRFNRALSSKSKSIMTYSVLGNHDHWQWGHPVNDNDTKVKMTDAAFGYGWTQFWAQDTLGVYGNAKSGIDMYGGPMLHADSVDYKSKYYTQPDPIHAVPMAFSSSYFVEGNMGYVLFSGIWKFEAQKNWLVEACKAMETSDVTSIWLVGHFSEDIYNPKAEGYDKHAAGAHLSTRRLFQHIASGDLGTDSPCYVAYKAGQLKFLQGHDHWHDCVLNQTIMQEGITTTVCAGWQVAGVGKGLGTLDGTHKDVEKQKDGELTTACKECNTRMFSLATIDTRKNMLQMGFLHMVSDMIDLMPKWSSCFAQMGDDFSFGFIQDKCEDDDGPEMVYLWSQPLKQLFNTSKDLVVV